LILVLVPIQIVCGAANVNAGRAPVATIGTVLYDKEAVPFTLKRKN
jgi:phenylalanyl-tRNA synthetase beta chain